MALLQLLQAISAQTLIEVPLLYPLRRFARQLNAGALAVDDVSYPAFKICSASGTLFLFVGHTCVYTDCNLKLNSSPCLQISWHAVKAVDLNKVYVCSVLQIGKGA